MKENLSLKNNFHKDQLVYVELYKLRTIAKARIENLYPIYADVVLLSKYDNTSLKISGRRFPINYNRLKGELKDTIFGKSPCFQRSLISSSEELCVLLCEIQRDYSNIFGKWLDVEKEKLSSVKIEWNNRVTYHKGAHYNIRDNIILVSKTFQNTPEQLIKFIIYHELLHIRCKQHNKFFRLFEKQFNDFTKMRQLFEDILKETRFFGKTRINKLPFKKETS